VIRLPESPRTRRRLLYLAAALVILVAIGGSQVVLGTSTGPVVKPAHPGTPQIVASPKTVRASRADLAAAAHTLSAFVPSAFVRRHLARSWPLATPHMKQDTTRAEWLAGNLPVVPYPKNEYRTSSYRNTYSYAGVLGYDVLVLPKHQDGPQQVYSCELDDVHGRWLVDYCVPRKTL
jgi:hypothetical protein